MKKMSNRLLCMLLTLCMLLSLFTGVHAAPSATDIVTTPTGYTSAGDVTYKTVDGYLANWGARGEDCTFLSTYAQSFYTGSYTYANLSAKSGGTSTSTAPSSALYSSLQTLMVDNHTYFTRYGSTNSNDCKYIYQYTDCMLGDPAYVSTLYRGELVGGTWDSGVSYNQEHIWPQSKCTGGNSEDVGDIMHLRPANPSENSSRGNTAYGESSGYYDPGVSVRGDCARTVLYMYVRWGNTGYMWGTEGVMESLDVLLRWMQEDPVDTWEMGRNDAVQSITGTRNVFVDYPEYAWQLFGQTVPTNMGTPSNGQSSGGSGSGDSGNTDGDFTAMAHLVTDAASLKAGDQIIITALDFDYALSTTQNTNNRSQSTVTKSDTAVQYGADTQVLTLRTGSLSGTFALEAGSGQYLCSNSSTANQLRTTDTIADNSSWTISINTSGIANVVANGSNTRNTLRYNMGSDLFSCYAADSTQRDISIYKLGTAEDDPIVPPEGDTEEDGTVLVTKISELTAGTRIIIAALDYDFAMSTTQNTNNRGQAAITKSGTGITYGTDVEILTLRTGSVSGTFALETMDGDYLYAASSTANYLKSAVSQSDNACWTISIDASTGAASILGAGTYTRNVMRYNTSSKIFSCYAENNTQKDLCIYKLTAACAHSYTSKITTAATCTTTGVRTYTCSKCGSSYTETVATTAHSYTSKVTAPTCTAQGYTTYTCSGCGSSYKDTYTAATGHSYSSKVTTAATCTNNGVRTYTCSDCGSSYTEAIAATGHSYTAKVTAPTCTAQGYTTYTCSSCGNSYKDAYTAITGHSYTSSVTTAATCTAAGVRTYTCSKCSYSYTEAIAATGHSYSNGKCTVCGAVDPNCTHSYTSRVTTAATCTTTGIRTYTCSKCGSSYTEIIAATGHSYSSKVTAPTCTAQGYTTYTCTTCGSSYKSNYTGANGHSYSGGFCTSCGVADPNYAESATVPTIGLKYPTVSFEDMILMNVYYSAANTQDVVEMGLVTYTTEPSAADVATADEVIPGYTLNESDGYYFSTTAGIAPKDLGDTIYFAVYYKLKDGTYGYTGVAGYSPKTYALGQLNTGTAEMKALVVAMLNYGAAAQTYFGYNTGSLMNATLTAEQNALVAAYSDSMIATVTQASGTKLGSFINDSTYTKRYPTISFEGAFCINYYYQPSLAVVGDVTMYIWSLEDYNAASVLTKSNATKSVKMTLTETGEYMATVDGIAAKDLDKAAYVSFVYSDGTTEHCGGVLGYTIGMYCKSQASKTGTLAELSKACAVYGYYAKQLFG